MTMQVQEHPKPRIFGKGYGTHIAYHFKLFTQFAKIAVRTFVTMLIPGAYHEQYHWDIIDLYHKFRGYRHGTTNEKRCNECGTELMSRDEVRDLRDAEEVIEELKDQVSQLEDQIEIIEKDVTNSDK